MLKYKVRLTENDFKDNNIIWREKYVAPDLSFISGVTDSSYHLEKHDTISVISPLTNNNSVLSVECEVVTRLGYVIVRGKKYRIKTFNGNDYVELNGRFFYKNNGKFTIKDWQCEVFARNENGKYVPKIVEKTVEPTIDGNFIKLDTVYWIEDGYVTIDGNKYIFDKDEQQPNGTKGCIKYTDKGTNITALGDIDCIPYDDVSLIHDVCKFKAYSIPFVQYKPKSIKYCEKFFYTKHGEDYCPVIPSSSKYVCQVPSENDPSAITNYNVSAYTDDDTSIIEITTNDAQDINDLDKFKAFIKINDDTYEILGDYRETSASRLIMVMLEDQGAAINVGDEITFVCTLNGDESYIDLEDNAILYDGNRYDAEANLFDKALINGNEYDITYDDFDSSIAYVNIEGEQVPMNKNGSTLKRYGLVMVSGDVPTSESYRIKQYSGVTIEGNRYIIRDNVAELTIPRKIKFVVDDIKGNSLFICEASISPNEYSSGTIHTMQTELASEIIANQDEYSLQINNNVFGSKPISRQSIFSSVSGAISSDDAYNIFDNLEIENKNGYVNIPINLNVNIANNLLQSEVIQKDFCEREKEKAINRIVDLEKDVYTPKIMLNANYSGSTTDFTPVHTINVNLHFRTRNIDNWKVNEDYNDISLSGFSNWFITDFEPYRSMIASVSGIPETKKDERKNKYERMISSSDLLGLMYFNNNDVFYQKSRIAKSFLRFSYYDSTDPQTQSLLATSTVFMDEHKLFKRYIDNSRKGMNTYISFSTDELSGCVETSRINVTSERLRNEKAEKGDKINFIEIGEAGKEKYISVKDDGKRIDSRFVIDNKYTTDTSSEGFYIYMFREYAEKLHPKPIYMKIEFNHAGIGKTIPFIVPMKWTSGLTKNNESDEIIVTDNGFEVEETSSASSSNTEYYEVYPERMLTLSANTSSGMTDLEILKMGIPLSWVYAQAYIPLYAVYDFKNKEYGYVFDNRYVMIKDNVVTLNLFEAKIMNDTDPDSNYGTAVINYKFEGNEENI